MNKFANVFKTVDVFWCLYINIYLFFVFVKMSEGGFVTTFEDVFVQKYANIGVSDSEVLDHGFANCEALSVPSGRLNQCQSICMYMLLNTYIMW